MNKPFSCLPNGYKDAEFYGFIRRVQVFCLFALRAGLFVVFFFVNDKFFVHFLLAQKNEPKNAA